MKNVPFKLINEIEAKKIVSEYNGEPAFYYNGTGYLVKGKANISSAIHEVFTHPFLIAIEKENPTLYNNLLILIKSNKNRYKIRRSKTNSKSLMS